MTVILSYFTIEIEQFCQFVCRGTFRVDFDPPKMIPQTLKIEFSLEDSL